MSLLTAAEVTSANWPQYAGHVVFVLIFGAMLWALVKS